MQLHGHNSVALPRHRAQQDPHAFLSAVWVHMVHSIELGRQDEASQEQVPALRTCPQPRQQQTKT